jgi:hypothetical protein
VPVDLVSVRLNGAPLTANPSARSGPDLTDGQIMVQGLKPGGSSWLMPPATPVAAPLAAASSLATPSLIVGNNLSIEEDESVNTPTLTLKTVASKGFALGAKSANVWLDPLVSQTAAKANAWTISAPGLGKA